jgi:hypothetical protein
MLYKEKEVPCKNRNLFRKKKLWRPLAQLVEQLAFNQFVEGSNPSRPTTFFLITSIMQFNCAFVDDEHQHKIYMSAVSSVGRAVGF